MALKKRGLKHQEAVSALRESMEEVKLDISGVMEKDGKRIAYVRFSRGEDYAEGYIPDCVFTTVRGFSDEETSQLKDYLQNNLSELKRHAASIDPLKAFMGKTGK